MLSDEAPGFFVRCCSRSAGAGGEEACWELGQVEKAVVVGGNAAAGGGSGLLRVGLQVNLGGAARRAIKVCEWQWEGGTQRHTLCLV
jgi:hypothetical protein